MRSYGGSRHRPFCASTVTRQVRERQPAPPTCAATLSPDRTLRVAKLPPGEDPDDVHPGAGQRNDRGVLQRPRSHVRCAVPICCERQRGEATPGQRAAVWRGCEAQRRALPDRSLEAEYRRTLLGPVFRRPAQRPQRPGAADPAPPALSPIARIAISSAAHSDRHPAAPSDAAARRGTRLCRPRPAAPARGAEIGTPGVGGNRGYP